MSNYYAQAIQVLADSKTDFRALAYEIAKNNPKAICKAAERLEGGFGWKKECAKLMAAGKLVEAVKRCREQTGMSLIDSKNAVEALV